MSDSSPPTEIPAIGYLSEVSLEHRQALTAYGKFVRPTNGERLITQGEPQATLYLVISGKLHVTSASVQRNLLLASLREGDSIGEINLFDPSAASADVIARGECLIWGLTREELETLMEAEPEAGNSVMRGLLHQLSRRIRAMNEKLADAGRMSEIQGYWTAVKR